MRYLKFLVYQFLLFAALIAIHFYFGEAIRKQPFSHVSILATILTVLLAMLAFGWGDIIEKRVGAIRLRYRLLFSFLALILASFSFGLLTGNIVF
ncbi:hypothetical protein [Metabacillus fastidiosus]|uniref:hypothetical protein n=1 Tax=Metabacillus fastidiosus TaxID=1458 RepID=UPI002DB9BC71|nr:hypothetical protein [Metabacillus fastidiosus]MEC2075846.1 hypothetical protein [Metabacillus fastidiosus]